jgi:PAS domain S-box-containing protein
MIKDPMNRSSQEKESLPQSIFNATADGIIVNDISTGLVIEANQAAAAMHGYGREEFIGLTPGTFTHPVSRHLFLQYAETVKAGNLFEALAIHVRKDGSSFHVEWHGTLFNHEGQSYLLGTIRDVSQRIDEERIIRKWVEERTHEQATLLEISQAFASELELKPGFILEQLRGIIEYTHAGLFAVEESSLVILTTHNPRELEQAPPLNMKLDVPETLTLLFSRRRPIRIADVNGDDPAAAFLRSFLINEASALDLPIRNLIFLKRITRTLP